MLFASHLFPNRGLRLDLEITQRAVPGRETPFSNSLELGALPGRKEIACLREGAFQTRSAKKIVATFEQSGFKLDRQQLLNQGNILVDKLLLERDRVSGDDRFASGSNGIESGWDQVCERLSHASARFNNEVLGGFERPGHIAGHLLLLGTILVI
jgi:hypothetical protein